MSSGILTVDASERRAWDLLLERAGGGDQFHRSGYVHALARERAGIAEAAWLECAGGCAFYPYIKTSIGDGSSQTLEIESPYGYSGPVFSSDSPDLLQQFYERFHRWCSESGVVTEFIRLNPFLLTPVPRTADHALVSSDLYVADLARPLDLVWGDIRKGHRQSVKKAQTLDVRPIKMRLGERVSAFWRAYTDTMYRNSATAEYLFSEEFFAALDEACVGTLDLWTASWRDQEVAYVLVLRNGAWAHYFLSASSDAGRQCCATHLLLWTAMQDLAQQGCRSFNLGGAPAGDVPLESFKRGFARQTTVFHTARLVHNASEFSRLCAAAGVTERLDGYFPPYRRSAAPPQAHLTETASRSALVIYGAGRHAAVVADCLNEAADRGQSTYRVAAYLDDDPHGVGRWIGGAQVSGGLEHVDGYVPDHAFIVAIGENARRRAVFEQLDMRSARLVSVQHRKAIVAPDVIIGRGTLICAGVIVNPASRIGDNVILNTGCTVDHHNVIGSHAHIAPGAHLGGEVRVGHGALVGIGAAVLPGLTIGDGAVVGAGAVVTRDVPPGAVVIGSPARVSRTSPSPALAETRQA